MGQSSEIPASPCCAGSGSSRKVEYLSPPANVSMADSWFEIASLEHFWIRRRFQVLQQLTRGDIAGAGPMAEVGCGNGLLQRQVEDAYGREVTGFDLNEYALQRNLSRRSRVCCYDIFQRNPALRQCFDVIFLFDVLEHISDEDRFLSALLFHLRPQGKLVINVPAGAWAFSAYDMAAGHVRRYSAVELDKRMTQNGMAVLNWTYWGLPLVPMLAVRKLWLLGKRDEQSVISSGFSMRSSTINWALAAISRCEMIPQKIAGTSLMAVLRMKGR
jgi:SAM-dependent methyltransferase